MNKFNYNINTGAKIHALYAEWERTPKNYEGEWNEYASTYSDLPSLWWLVMIKYDNVSKEEIISWLNKIKAFYTTPNSNVGGFYQIDLLDYVRTSLKCDVLPCLLYALTTPQHRVHEIRQRHTLTVLLQGYGDKLSQDILAAILAANKSDKDIQEDMRVFARKKWGAENLTLSVKPRSRDDILKALGMEEWPLNAVPNNIPLRETCFNMTPAHKLIREHGYWVSLQGFLDVLRDGVRADDDELTSAALDALYSDKCVPELQKNIAEIAAEFRSKHTLGALKDRRLLVQWAARLALCDLLDTDEWKMSLSEAKDLLLDPSETTRASEALTVMDVAYFRLKLDVFPCAVGVLLTNRDLEWYDHFIPRKYVESVYKDRITRELLIGMCKMQGGDERFRKLFDALAKEKFNSSFDELSKQEVDIEAVKKSLNLDQWPDSVLSKEAETQETLGEK